MELGYPGGPKIEELAKKGDASAFNFPRPMTNKNNLDFSFSGLKTAVYYEYKKFKQISDNQKADIAASFQTAVADTSNKFIREKLINGLEGNKIFFPPIERCTDNGAMIAFAGSFYLNDKEQDMNLDIKPRWPLSELNNG